MTWAVELPLPPTCCSPNYSAGRVRTQIEDNQRKAAYRQECAQRIRNASKKWKIALPLSVPVTLHWVWYCGRGDARQQLMESLYPCYRPRDVGNALGALKVAIDAFMDAGVLSDDDYRHVDSITARVRYTTEQHHGVAGLCVTITPCENDL